MWRGPWRVEWARRFEHWYRYQIGPFYVLRGRKPTMTEAMLRQARLARLLFVRVPHECENDPDPDYGF